MHPISLVSDADFDDSTDMGGEKHFQSTHCRGFSQREIDEAGFVRQCNFFYLPIRMLCLCLALMNLFAWSCTSFELCDHVGINTTLGREVGQIVTGRRQSP